MIPFSNPMDMTSHSGKWTAGKKTKSATAPMRSKNSWQGVLTADWQNGGFGLYVHWPFCAAKCPYCDFNSHVTRSVDHAAWRVALVDEVNRLGKETHGRVLRSVFFGGGTPSLMEPATVGAVLDTVHAVWPTANDLEV